MAQGANKRASSVIPQPLSDRRVRPDATDDTFGLVFNGERRTGSLCGALAWAGLQAALFRERSYSAEPQGEALVGMSASISISYLT